jgi:hypothetical protein
MKINLSDYEIGWLVGLLEGEGYFAFIGKHWRVTIEMVDLDVIQTAGMMFAKMTGKEQKIYAKPIKFEGAQQSYQIQVTSKDSHEIMEMLVPYMHSRRRSRIWQCLNRYSAPKAKTLKELGFDINDFIKARLKQKEESNDRDSTNERRSSPIDDGGDSGSGDADYPDNHGDASDYAVYNDH